VLILALDGATAHPSLALWRDGVTLAALRPDATGPGGAVRSDTLALRAEAVLAEAGLGFAALDRLAVTIGPGRFTGLRAGLAFMRGLALALDAKLIGVTTLEALRPRAHAAPGEIALACIGSGRAELFFAIDDGPAFACLPSALDEHLPDAATIAVIGEETEAVAAALAAHGRAVRRVPRAVDAADVAALAATRTPPAASPGPLYIHPPAVTSPKPRMRAAPAA
jgi:tRNA threonylcarbamoyladenosine biosynthesis protein TsaB